MFQGANRECLSEWMRTCAVVCRYCIAQLHDLIESPQLLKVLIVLVYNGVALCILLPLL
jgi:hypothetical protein